MRRLLLDRFLWFVSVLVFPLLLITVVGCTTTSNNCEPDGGLPDGGANAPQTQLVKLSDLMTVLPNDTATVTPEDRAEQISIRQHYQRDKYAPW